MGGKGNPVVLTTPPGKSGCSQDFQVTASGKVWAVFISSGDYVANIYYIFILLFFYSIQLFCLFKKNFYFFNKNLELS